MMNRYAAFSFFTVAALVAQGQFVNITNSSGTVVNGQLVVTTGAADEALLTSSLFATRNGSTQLNVNVKRYETSVQSGTENYFCWGVCYDAVPSGALPFWAAGQEGVLPMAPGVTLDNFHAYHKPMGIAGPSTYRYVWYNAANALDSVFVDIRFDVAAVGIDELSASGATLVAMPSIAVGEDIRLECAVARAAQGTQVVVRDMLGAAVRRQVLAGQQASFVLPASEWTPGVYFVTIERGNAILATRRVVVAR